MKRVIVFLVGGVLVCLVLWFGLFRLGWWGKVFGKYNCPVGSKYCRLARVVDLRGEYYGLGFKLPEGEEIISAVKSVSLEKGVFMLARDDESLEKYRYLKMKGEDYVVVYLINGEPLEVEKNKDLGEELGRIPGDNLELFGDYDLVVYWENTEENKIKVLPRDFK